MIWVAKDIVPSTQHEVRSAPQAKRVVMLRNTSHDEYRHRLTTAAMRSSASELTELLGAGNRALYEIQTTARGPQGELPLTDEMLRSWPSGDLFGLTQSAGMGWKPEELLGPQFLILSTQGGVRAPDGTPIALGYHTG